MCAVCDVVCVCCVATIRFSFRVCSQGVAIVTSPFGLISSSRVSSAMLTTNSCHTEDTLRFGPSRVKHLLVVFHWGASTTRCLVRVRMLSMASAWSMGKLTTKFDFPIQAASWHRINLFFSGHPKLLSSVQLGHPNIVIFGQAVERFAEGRPLHTHN